MLIILSFNARPIVEACIDLGLEPVVIDYFGDEDIRQIIHHGHFYADHAELDVPSTEGFKMWALETLERIIKERGSNGIRPERSFLLVGSGFDDDFEFWNQCGDMAFILGNDAHTIEKARDFDLVKDLCKNRGVNIHFPRTIKVTLDRGSSTTEIVKKITNTFNFPVLVKKMHSGGGLGIDLVKNETELKKFLLISKKACLTRQSNAFSFRIQEFIRGKACKDISALLHDGHVICITEQLIGEPMAFPPRPFSYCGNIIPLKTSSNSLPRDIESFAQLLKEELHIKGLHGVDLVMRGNELFFMEINPRIPGSLEPASIALGKNLMEDHFLSFPEFNHGKRKSAGTKLETWVSIKCILFARKDFTMPALIDLKIDGILKDLTPTGTFLEGGMPVLTYLNKKKAGTSLEIKNSARREIKKIYEIFDTTSFEKDA